MLHRAERLFMSFASFALATAILLMTTSFLVTGCSKKEPEAKEIIRPVKMMTIGDGAGSGTREYSGSVRAAEEIQLSFEVPGRIVELNAREGQAMADGALVAALDPRDYEAARDRERARRNEARADYERNRTLYERDAISLRDLEVVRRQFEVSEANLKQAEKALSDTRLYAPYDGKIAGRLVENFENVTAKQAIVVFHDDSSPGDQGQFPGGRVPADPRPRRSGGNDREVEPQGGSVRRGRPVDRSVGEGTAQHRRPGDPHLRGHPGLRGSGRDSRSPRA